MTQRPSLALHTLSNGLRVYTMEIHRAPVVNFMVWYDVGSRNEGPGTTGNSHFLEHMMFKGTPLFPYGTIEDAVRDRGGVWNAFTWLDFTAYYEVLPAKHVELAMQIEADRMQNMIFDRDLTVRERGIIVSEREGYENRPTHWLSEALRETAFQVHPYRHHTLGTKDDIKGTTAEKLTAHYQTYYRPNNAVVVAVGDFRTADLLKMVEKHFGQIPAGEPVPRLSVVEPMQSQERRVTVKRPSPTPYLMVGWRTPPATHPDSAALDVLNAILSGASPMGMGGGAALGRSSRLYRRMVEGGLTADASTTTWDTAYPGLFTAAFTVKPDVDPQRVEEALYEEIETLKAAPPPAEEFERALKQIRAQYTYAQDSVMSQGINIGATVVVTGSPDHWINYLDRLAGVKPEDVSRVAREYLHDQGRTVAVLAPDQDAKAQTAAPGGPPAGTEPEEGTTPWYQKREHGRLPEIADPLADEGRILLDPDKVVQRELPGGMTLLVYPIEGMPSVAMRISLEAGSVRDPQGKAGVAQLTADLLTRGTQRYSAEELAIKTDSLGMSLSVDSGRETVLGHVKCLKEDLGTGIELLAEVLRRPTFPEAEFKRQKERTLVRIRQALNDTRIVADRKLTEMLYPQGHPYRHPVSGDLESVSALGRDDLASHHTAYFGAKGAVAIVVGDVHPDRVEAAFNQHFAGWQGGAERLSIPSAAPAPARREHVAVPGKTQADIAMGWALVERSHPDYLPLEFLATLLGRSGTGATGRLFRDVREKHGLSYYQYSLFNSARGPASWSIHIGVNPARLNFALDVLKGEIRRLHDEPVPVSERESLLAFLEGIQALKLESAESVAANLEHMYRHQLGFDYLQKYPKLLQAVTPEELQAKARQYLELEKLTTVTAGPELDG